MTTFFVAPGALLLQRWNTLMSWPARRSAGQVVVALAPRQTLHAHDLCAQVPVPTQTGLARRDGGKGLLAGRQERGRHPRGGERADDLRSFCAGLAGAITTSTPESIVVLSGNEGGVI
jgi:hypothetical protein